MKISRADAEYLARRAQGMPGPNVQELAWITDPLWTGFRIVMPGRIRNPLNDQKLHGFAWTRYKNKWQEALDFAMLTLKWDRTKVDPKWPKEIEIQGRVFNYFDSKTEGLRAALKPIPDGLKKLGVIDDDRDSSPHTFTYSQVINRACPGVFLMVRWRADHKEEDQHAS